MREFRRVPSRTIWPIPCVTQLRWSTKNASSLCQPNALHSLSKELFVEENLDLGEISFDRVFNARRDVVFRCMTNPADLCHFFGPAGVSAPIEKMKIELRTGGAFETVMVNDATGEEYPSIGEVVEVSEPTRLVCSEKASDNPEQPAMTTAIDFYDLGDGTTRTVTVQSNVPAMYRSPEARAGMESYFEEFDKYLASLA